jgi:hypothetical protein
MHNNSLVKLLRTFTPKEISDFKDFLISPYFNKKNSVVKLYEILRRSYPQFTGSEISKKNIHVILFPGKSYNDTNLRVLVHNLNDLAKKFLAYRSFESSKIEFDFRQFTGLMEKQQFSYLEKMLSKLKADLEKESFIADDYNFHRFRLEYENIFFLYESHLGVFERFLHKADFEKAFYYLSSYYYIKSMRLYINVLNLQLIYNKKFETSHFDKMVGVIDKDLINENPVIEIFYLIIKLFEDDAEEKYYYRIKELLKRIRNYIHISDIGEIYINLTNFCNRKINSGVKKFKMEKFELYKEENELKMYIVNGYMPPVYYKNLVILGLSLDEYKWVKNFISDYKYELPEDSRLNIHNYCMALYEFDMRKFDKALELLSMIKFDELYLKYDSKILQLMIYYETGSEESLLSSLEAYRHFLSNNKLLPENKKEMYTNFHKFFSKLFLLKSKKDITELERLKHSITGDIKIFNKEWIIRKIDEQII